MTNCLDVWLINLLPPSSSSSSTTSPPRTHPHLLPLPESESEGFLSVIGHGSARLISYAELPGRPGPAVQEVEWIWLWKGGMEGGRGGVG